MEPRDVPVDGLSPSRRADRVAEVRDTLLVLTASAFMLAGFAPLFSGVDWYLVVLSVIVPVGAVALMVRLLAPAWATAASAVAAVVSLVWVFAPGTTIAGVPTPGSFGRLRDLLGQARTVIIEEAAPITPPDSVVLVVAIAMLVTFVLADAVARQPWRTPLLGLLWATLIVVPSIISMQMPSWWVFAGTAACWLALWWFQAHHVGHGAGRAAAVTAAVAIAAAVVLPAVAPRIEPTSSTVVVERSDVFGQGINPMIELGRDLRQSEPRRVLNYTTDQSGGVYLKVATLRNFNGRTWSPSSVFSESDSEDLDLIDPDIEVEETTTDVSIQRLRTTYLPVPYPATEIRGLEGDWDWGGFGGSVRARGDSSSEDQTYSVTSLNRLPTAPQARAAEPASDDFNRYRVLPPSVPDLVVDEAYARTEGADNDYDRMVRLQDWMRSQFSYSVEAPVEQGYDGNGVDAMEDFLLAESGYCVHFASTLAVMGRVLGVPTRVAVGYAPGGTVVSRTPDETTYGVDSDDLHAWTEAYLPGIGWVPFDATPGIGEQTSYAEPVDDTADPDAATPGQAEPDGSDETLAPTDETAADATQAVDSSTPWRSVLLVAATVVLLGGGPAVVREARRRRRWRAGERSAEPLWLEVEDTARDLGLELDPAETPRRFAGRLSERGAGGASLATLVDQVERSRYGALPTDQGAVEEAKEVVSSLRSISDRRTRWYSRIWPRSLFR